MFMLCPIYSVQDLKKFGKEENTKPIQERNPKPILPRKQNPILLCLQSWRHLAFLHQQVFELLLLLELDFLAVHNLHLWRQMEIQLQQGLAILIQLGFDFLTDTA